MEYKEHEMTLIFYNETDVVMTVSDEEIPGYSDFSIRPDLSDM